MAATTLTEVFGSGAVQNGDTISFTISGLAAAGLSGGSTNPDAILTACLLNLKATQGATAGEDVARGVVINDSEFKNIARNDTQLERQLSISVYTPLSIQALDPDAVI